jgi:hypothetical protein
MLTGSRRLGACLLFLLPASLLAQTPALDLKVGLWDMTTATDLAGQMPAMDTSKMPPAQRAQIEAAMKGLLGPKTTTDKSCVRKEDFSLSKLMKDDDPDMKCKRTITTNTRTTLEATIVCTGDSPMTGQMRVDAVSPTSMNATMKMSGARQGRPMAINITTTGKWLGADCKGID